MFSMITLFAFGSQNWQFYVKVLTGIYLWTTIKFSHNSKMQVGVSRWSKLSNEFMALLGIQVVKHLKNFSIVTSGKQINSFQETPSLCLLQLVLHSSFSAEDVFQFLYTVLCEILNVTSDHSCRCMKNCVYNTFNLRFFCIFN